MPELAGGPPRGRHQRPAALPTRQCLLPSSRLLAADALPTRQCLLPSSRLLAADGVTLLPAEELAPGTRLRSLLGGEDVRAPAGSTEVIAVRPLQPQERHLITVGFLPPDDAAPRDPVAVPVVPGVVVPAEAREARGVRAKALLVVTQPEGFQSGSTQSPPDCAQVGE